MSEDADQLRLEVGPVAHGGSCVARHEGRVVFVRHALPGELVAARVTDGRDGDRFWRADAIQVLRASPDRVASRCPLAGPGGCGGCDWQHATLDAQRLLKADVVREQLRRLAGVHLPDLGLPDLVVQPLPDPGPEPGLGWRTRMRFAVDDQGRPGLHRHRSHVVVPVPSCPISNAQIDRTQVGRRRWPGAAAVEVAVAEGADPLVVVEPAPRGQVEAAAPTGATGAGGRVDPPPLPVPVSLARRDGSGLQRVRGRTWLEHCVLVDGQRRRFRVTGGGFWQVHPAAPQALVDAVLAATDPRPGERAVDLYSGVGLFTAALAVRVGEHGSVLAVEADPRACADARRSLYDLPWVRIEQGRVGRALAARVAEAPWRGRADVVVLDPPRAGAGREVLAAVTGLAPRVIAYVACDPAALARDVAIAAELGYRLGGLAAFDAFPMTHHVECVATLVRPSRESLDIEVSNQLS